MMSQTTVACIYLRSSPLILPRPTQRAALFLGGPRVRPSTDRKEMGKTRRKSHVQMPVNHGPPDPLPHEVAGSALSAGMRTYQRAVVNGQVKFRLDCVLLERLYDTGACNGLHFRTGKQTIVCYWRNARVWVKEASQS